MPFLRQTLALSKKTLTIVLVRHWAWTFVRAFILPLAFTFFISYAKNLFVPPGRFGISEPHRIRSLGDALDLSSRSKVAFVTNGHTGRVLDVIDSLSKTVRAHGKTVEILESDVGLLTTCRSSVRGVSDCFGAVSFAAASQSPYWNYTLRADGSLGERIYVDRDNNDAQIYTIPLQHAVDSAIASIEGVTLTPDIYQFPYTSQTSEQRAREINHLYMGSLIKILAAAYILGICGVTYHLTGEVAKERENGMSQLMEAMMPNRKRWVPQVARLLATHLSFSLIYCPSWVLMGLIVADLNFALSNAGIIIGYFILAGLALSSWSIGIASLFRKAQLSGITVVLLTIILAIIVQVVPPTSTGTAVALSLIFPPINFVLFVQFMAYWQQSHQAANLQQTAPNAPWQFIGALFFVFLAIQIVVYPILGAMFERWLYGTASSARQLRYDDEDQIETIKMRSVTKSYSPSWWHRNVASIFTKVPKQTVVAVDNIDFSLRRGQISVLLGQNGSGKTTSLDILSGLQAPTSGTIEIEASGGIGIAPQKNVLWAELTAYEHVSIFSRLKGGLAAGRTSIEQLLRDCDLEQKIHARSGTLSGGQKRKLQLAIMLVGGSKVCLIDEVSSGLDPLARRKVWDIILAERGRRSILLTSHYLDEADLLSDDITILSRGRVAASGSSVALKNSLGGGYRVAIFHRDIKPLPVDVEAIPKLVLADQIVYQLADSAAAASFVDELERAGIREYSLDGPQIEDVFLKISAEEPQNDHDSEKLVASTLGDKGLRLTNGRPLSLLAQSWVLFRKRITILRTNFYPHAAALLIPIIAGGLVTFFIKHKTALSCLPTAQASTETSYSLDSLIALEANIPAGPPSGAHETLITELYPLLKGSLDTIASLQGLEDYIQANYSTTDPGGFVTSNPTFGWRGNYGVYFATLTQNLLDVALSGVAIDTAFEAFAVPWSPDAGNTLQFILYYGLAMSIYPAFFCLYTTMERLRHVRPLHYSNGVRAQSLWLAYILFDFVVVLLVSTISIIIFTAISGIFYGPGYLFVVLVFYGLSATLFAHIVSLTVSSQLAAFAVAAGAQAVMFLVALIAYMCIITYSEPGVINRDVNIANFTLAFFFPAGNLLRALLLTFNEFSLLCRGDSVASNPGGIDVYGGPILYTILQSIFFLAVLVIWDSGWKPSFLFWGRKQRIANVEESEEVDAEVFAEQERLNGATDALRVLHLTKIYGSNVAVDDITFGVGKGTTMALCGPNGAGKSTTFSLVRGDQRPSNRTGEILVDDVSVIKHRAKARVQLGVCPQVDAIDAMTAEEHLKFYARVRGVSDVNHNVDQIIQAVGLSPFRTRMAAALSGGNKRKLSLAIALMGNPTVLLLDEPSSSLDPMSKRKLWATLQSVSGDRSVLISTHSMEEVHHLADRVAIIARRMLAIGTADELRKKHSDAYYIHVVHRDAPNTADADMERIRAFVRDNFAGATMEDRAFHGQIRFSVPVNRAAAGEKSKAVASTDGPSRGGIQTIFRNLEDHKTSLGLENYSVSQATLDQVFLRIVSRHNVIEENYAREHQPKRSWHARLRQSVGKKS